MSAGPSEPKKSRSKEATVPVEVVILTPDHEVSGLVYVSRDAKPERRISDLLNDPEKRFLAVTDAHLVNRVGPSTKRVYSFLQLHIDNIIMIHPAVQAAARNTEYDEKDASRFENLRTRVKGAPASK